LAFSFLVSFFFLQVILFNKQHRLSITHFEVSLPFTVLGSLLAIPFSCWCPVEPFLRQSVFLGAWYTKQGFDGLNVGMRLAYRFLLKGTV
jgi:hypothetical protein